MNSFYISIKLFQVAIYDNNSFKAKLKYCTWHRTAVEWGKKPTKAVKIKQKARGSRGRKGKLYTLNNKSFKKEKGQSQEMFPENLKVRSLLQSSLVTSVPPPGQDAPIHSLPEGAPPAGRRDNNNLAPSKKVNRQRVTKQRQFKSRQEQQNFQSHGSV